MMIKQIKKTSLVLLVPSVLAYSGLGFAANAEDRYMYAGVVGGISEPVVKDFEEKVLGLTTKMRLKQSRMYGGRVGYSFYPGMMIELAVEHQPTYKLAYKLPSYVTNGITVPELFGRTKISADVIAFNLLYELQEQYAGVKPYVLFGAGMSRLHIRPTSSSTDAFALIGLPNLTTFRIKDSKMNCYSWQFGGGITRNITDHFAVDLGAKLRVVHGIKLKYDTVDSSTQGFNRQKPIKKTLGVGEFTLGFLFKLPV
jgi:opacity protein-like surface antigen